MKDFALIGAAGFVAERHLSAIKNSGNRLIAACDPFDVVGRLDHYFPETDFFTDFEQFEQFIDSNRVDFTSICSPNYLHAQHIQAALHAGSNVICEKPLVLFPGELEAIEKASEQSGCSVFPILQLRLHPVIQELKNDVNRNQSADKFDLELTYITARGKWYDKSWKGDEHQSGGIAANIGIHFFDMLCWIFGKVMDSQVHLSESRKMAGYLELERARVRWFLSVDHEDLPEERRKQSKSFFRELRMNGRQIDFSDGFSDLHLESYRHILAGQGFNIADAKAGIQLTHQIRNTPACRLKGEFHELVK